MLVVFSVRPGPAPFKTVFRKKLICQIVFIDFMRKVSAVVDILTCRCRFQYGFPIDFLDVRIVKRVNINSQLFVLI
jgi:hypothetical protein